MTSWIVAFLLYETFTAIQQWHLKNVVMDQRNAIPARVSGDVTGGAVSTAYVATAFFGRFNGIAFLLFIAWKHGVSTALLLWGGALLLGMVTNFVLRATTGYTGILLVARSAILAVPVTGVLAWWWAWNA